MLNSKIMTIIMMLEREWIQGRLLGIAWSTGDALTYIVIPEKE